MEDKFSVGPAGCKANASYFRTLRFKYTELALQAMSEEAKWNERLEMQKKFPRQTEKDVDLNAQSHI